MLMLKTRKNGLTLIEILVAVTIVAILAVGLFAVGSYIETQLKIERTKSTINMLVAALDLYGQNKGNNTAYKFPAPGDNLYEKLSLSPDSKKIVDQINRKAMRNEGSTSNPDIRFIDAWGSRFIYDYNEGWNFPVITSAGPDRDVNDPNTKDNISSKGL